MEITLHTVIYSLYMVTALFTCIEMATAMSSRYPRQPYAVAAMAGTGAFVGYLSYSAETTSRGLLLDRQHKLEQGTEGWSGKRLGFLYFLFALWN